ncbi:unnamed protein product [Phytophthora fragariaefolia]|uniref:Unnamed protein product n=1 Tax=Phytophthora fragariaefolia TaxID=1490495 RepID=A0A9W6Y6R0_9STRA|nr:unnamed protein product [Phytophthora fragariaefolia]
MLHPTLLLAIAVFVGAPLGVHAAECTDAEVTHDDQLWAWAASQTACAPNKIEVQNAITVCTGGGTTDPGSPTTESPSTTAPSPATTAPSPAATASNTNCADSEINDMVDLYTTAATSEQCANDSSVSSTSIVISTFCGSTCASKLEELASSLPNCYYGYQSENLKADLLEQLDACSGGDTSYAINAVLSPDETVEAPSTTIPAVTTSAPSTPSPPDSTTAPPATPSSDANTTSEPTPAPTKGDSGAYC